MPGYVAGTLYTILRQQRFYARAVWIGEGVGKVNHFPEITII